MSEATGRVYDAATGGLLARCEVPGVELHSLNECLREHGHGRWKRQAKLCARLAPWLNRALAGAALEGALVVTITRVAPRPYDGDNWSGGDAKAVRDWIAREYLRRDDKESATLRWAYRQERGGVRVYGVRIEIATRKDGE